MSSIKQLIVNAIIKVSSENPTLNREGEPSAEEARDNFIKLLLAELFPEDPSVPVSSPPKKTKKTKKTGPEPGPEPALLPEVPVVTITEEGMGPSSPAKKKRAPMTEEAKAAMKAKREAKKAEPVSPPSENSVLETVPVTETGSNAAAGAGGEVVKEKKTRKPKTAEDVNVPKIDGTWRKYAKSVEKKFPKEDETELLKYLNALSKDEFNAKKGEEHVADFIASRKPKPEDEKVEAELIEVDFNGKTYFVNPETKRVYEGEGTCDADGNWTNYKTVGYVGMATFADMKID